VQLREQTLTYRLVVRVLRPLLVLLARRDWRGTEHLPASGGLVVCANHMSHLDPLTLAHFLIDGGRPPSYLAKEELFSTPVIGTVVRRAEQIPVQRGTADARGALEAAVAAVRAGRCVVVYPESTLTRDPDLWPMAGKSGAARIALTTGCPVVPVAQWGPQDILFPYSKRLRLFPRRTVHVVAGPPVRLDDLRGQPIDADLLAEATRRIMADITGLLEQLRGETAPARPLDPPHQGFTDGAGGRS
jgi:1-acyl-sn-glycerol-3-phosphate acyltransferase